jgi:ABC-type sugar transport system ATPase subunit
MSTIALRNLTKDFGSLIAVRDVDLDVAAGEVVCLLGPSGCGKTTTLRMIAGLESVTRGEVIVAGRRMNDLPPEKRDIAMVFQFYALYPSITVGENIAFPLHYERLSRSGRRARVSKVAKILHLEGILDRLPGHISEGEKQRVAVARAIIRDPNCFLFDEPLSRLDIELRQTMRGQIKEVLAGLSKATVIVTHDQLEALTMADRVAIMREGVIEQVATPHVVFARPANVFVASFIGTPQMNLIEARLAGLGDGRARIDIGTRSMEFELGGSLAGMRPGAATLGIRPRAFTPVAARGPDTLTVSAELIEPMGAETLIHALAEAGPEIRVVIPREHRVKVGEILHLRADPLQTHIFDGEGKAVRS